MSAAAPYARWAILPGALALFFGAYAGRRMYTNRPELSRPPGNRVDG